LLIKFIKQRITYPRTGYIAYPKPKGKNFGMILGLGLGLTAIISGGLLLAIMLIPAVQTMFVYLPSWLMVWVVMFLALVYLSWGVRTGLRRFYWLAGIGFLTGLVLA
jgi:hypothetical protein